MSELTKEIMIEIATMIQEKLEDEGLDGAGVIFMVVNGMDKMYMSSILGTAALPFLKDQVKRLEGGSGEELEIASKSTPTGEAGPLN